jgi:GNAT superfamily N-acetyltransferase
MELELVTPSLKVERMSNERRSDFFKVHCKENGEGWCNCVAWSVPTWDGWGERTAEQNLTLRTELFDRGEFDGYLLYHSGEPVGWCQSGPRDRLSKLAQQYRLEPSPGTWAITCFVLGPKSRGKGFAQLFLKEVVADLFRSGVKHIQGFPKIGEQLDAGETWTGTKRMFETAGFTVERPHERFPVYGIQGQSN